MKYLNCLILISLLISCQKKGQDPATTFANNMAKNWSNQIEQLSATSHNWLKDLNDPKLTRLVTLAFEQNYFLKASNARLQIAQSQLTIAKADKYPRVEATARASRSQRSSSGGFQISQSISNQFILQLNASWEIDFWGKLRHQKQAAVMKYLSTQETLQAVKISIAIGIAKQWYQLSSYQQELTLQKNEIDNLLQQLILSQSRYQNGLGSLEEIAQIQIDLAKANSARSTYQQKIKEAENNLRLLSGQWSSNESFPTIDFPKLPKDIPLGIPTDLLKRRPDIKSLHYQLLASSAEYRQAKKNRYPSFTLTASGGFTSSDIKDLVKSDSIIWNLLTGLTQPIIDGKKLKAQMNLAKAKESELYFEFGQKLIEACHEVEDALGKELSLAQSLQSQMTAVKELEKIDTLKTKEYEQGLSQALTILSIKRQIIQTRIIWTQLMNQYLQNRISLYLALGGEIELTIIQNEKAVP